MNHSSQPVETEVELKDERFMQPMHTEGLDEGAPSTRRKFREGSMEYVEKSSIDANEGRNNLPSSLARRIVREWTLVLML